jgi:chromatin segregation and condensation protein Rec8/ScpA/Scc1 (kleisin family)
MERFAAAHPPPLQVLPLRYRVRDTMRDLYRRVAAEDVVPLLRDLQRRSDPEEVVVVFVAALELVRLGGVCAEQRRPFAEIYLRRGERELTAEDLEHLDQDDETDGA